MVRYSVWVSQISEWSWVRIPAEAFFWWLPVGCSGPPFSNLVEDRLINHTCLYPHVALFVILCHSAFTGFARSFCVSSFGERRREWRATGGLAPDRLSTLISPPCFTWFPCSGRSGPFKELEYENGGDNFNTSAMPRAVVLLGWTSEILTTEPSNARDPEPSVVPGSAIGTTRT